KPASSPVSTCSSMAESLSFSAPLAALLEARQAQLGEAAPRTAALLAADATLAAQARQVLLGSDFAHAALLREDGLLESLQAEGLHTPRTPAGYAASLAAIEAQHAGDEAACMRALRRLRRREMLRLAWRDIAGLCTVQDTLRETSWFASAAIASAARLAATLLAPRHGGPPADAGELIVLGMGKLGGCELNFSSDVDLVFLYPTGQGETDGPAPLSLEEYYTRQGRLLIRLLDAGTEEGFVFRVDM